MNFVPGLWMCSRTCMSAVYTSFSSGMLMTPHGASADSLIWRFVQCFFMLFFFLSVKGKTVPLLAGATRAPHPTTWSLCANFFGRGEKRKNEKKTKTCPAESFSVFGCRRWLETCGVRWVTKHGIYPELDLEETKNVLNVSASLMPLGPKLIEKKIVKLSSSFLEREAEYCLWKKKIPI